MPEKEDWLSPLNRIIWLRAFRARQTLVTLRDGRKFTVDYDRIPGKAWVDIASSEVNPCGWFDMERVTDDLFLSEQDNPRGTVNSFQRILG
jgi:hypothetical protein